MARLDWDRARRQARLAVPAGDAIDDRSAAAIVRSAVVSLGAPTLECEDCGCSFTVPARALRHERPTACRHCCDHWRRVVAQWDRIDEVANA